MVSLFDIYLEERQTVCQAPAAPRRHRRFFATREVWVERQRKNVLRLLILCVQKRHHTGRDSRLREETIHRNTTIRSTTMRAFHSRSKLTDATRAIRFRMAFTKPLFEDLLQVQHVSGVETMCGGIEYSLLCVSTEAGLELKQFIAVPAEIQFVTDGGKLRQVCGIIVAAMEGQSDGGLATYRLVLRDALSMLDQTSNTRVFRDENEVGITHILMREFCHANPVAGQAFECRLQGLPDYPQRSFTMQYNESTGAFLRRLWKRRGISWFIRPGAAFPSPVQNNDTTPIHTLVLFHHTSMLDENAAGAIRFHRDSATESRDTITAWHGIRTLTPGISHRESWEYKFGNNRVAEEFGINDQGELGKQCAATLDDYLFEAPHTPHDDADYAKLGLARMQRHEYESKCFEGEGSDRNMRVGEWNSIIGHPELDTHTPEERKFVITSLQVEADNNLPKELDDKVRKLFQLNRWRTTDAGLEQASSERGTRYSNRFTCVRLGIQIVPKYDPRVDMPRTDMQYVTVVGPAKQEIHCDDSGRVKVRFPGCRPADHAHASGAGASDSDNDSAWVQVASPWAGLRYGSISLPRVGDQVLCVFVGGDPDKPLIIGRAHGGRRPPPAFSRVSQLPGDRYLSGIVSKEGNHPATGQSSGRYNQLCMDDTPGEISAQLASAHGQSQLHLGYLTHPRSNSYARARGEGFELATNHSGAIRSAKSLLLSAWGRLDACGTQMDNAEHLALMQDCLDLFKTLGQYAASHQGVAVDEAPQTALKADLAEGASVKPTLSMTAPAGLALTTPAAIVSYAGKNIDSVAQQHLQMTSGERMNLHSGKALSLFAQSDGITQIAHKGKFLMQSQHDDMQFNAAQDLKATAGRRVVVMAEEEITFIVSGGAYLKLKGGTAEIGGPGALTIKTDGHHWNGPASGKTELPTFAEGDFSRIPRLLRPTDGQPVEGMQLHVARTGAGPLSSQSNAAGEGETVKADHLQQLTATFFKPLK
jgi:type VI secretion system secreted protein VgrG